MNKWNISQYPSQQGKVAIITGSNSGIGFENQLATNFICHFALTGLLMQQLLKTSGSRVITLISLSYKWAPINFSDLHFKNGYDKKKAYGQSKRACLVFAYELNRRLSSTGTRWFSGNERISYESRFR